jgi:hypothetical protein
MARAEPPNRRIGEKSELAHLLLACPAMRPESRLRLRAGDLVRHTRFGIGQIVAAHGRLATVAFARAGERVTPVAALSFLTALGSLRRTG